MHHIFKRCSFLFISTFRPSSFHVLSGAASFSVGLVSVMCKIVYIHSEHFWEDHFPRFLFQHVTHVFAGSFSSITSDQCYLSSLHRPFMSCIHPICHLSFTIDWPTPACSQLLTPTFSTHFLNFQTSTSLFLPCYWSSLGGACCKHSQSYFITAVLQISACDANRNLHNG